MAALRGSPLTPSSPGRPVLDLQTWHWKVLRVAGRQAGPRRKGRRGDEAVGLAERLPPGGEVAPPGAGQLSLPSRERHRSKGAQQAANRLGLTGSCTAPDLLHVDRADERGRLRCAQLAEALGCVSIAQNLDQHRGVEEENGSAHPALVSPPLGPDPGRRILIPFVSLVVDRPDRGEDLVPAALVVKGAPEHARDEGAAPPFSDSAVEFGHQLIIEA